LRHADGGGALASPAILSIPPPTRSITYFFLKESTGMKKSFTAIIEQENDGFVALCPELDSASRRT